MRMNTVCDEAGVLSERDLKLTAALCATLGVHQQVRRSGRLPEVVGDDCNWLPVLQIIATRGVDLALTPDEQLIYDAFWRAGRVPTGAVRVMS